MNQFITRMRFFNGLFLTEEEFNLEQQYHMALRRLSNAWFRSAGIIYGLEVSKTHQKNVVLVNKGAALDRTHSVNGKDEEIGREIYLPNPEEFSVQVEPGSTPKSLYLYVRYGEKNVYTNEERGANETLHILEKPILETSIERPDDGFGKILLAKLLLQHSDTGVEVMDVLMDYDDTSNGPIRTPAGMVANRLTTKEILFEQNDPDQIKPRITTELNGPELNLRIESPNTHFEGDLSSKGSVTIGHGVSSVDTSLDVQQGDVVFGSQALNSFTHHGPNLLDGDCRITGKTQIQNSLLVGAKAEFQSNVKINELAVEGDSHHGNLSTSGALKVSGQSELAELKAQHSELESLNVRSDTQIGTEEAPAKATLNGSLRLKNDNAKEQALLLSGNVTCDQKDSLFWIKGSLKVDGKLEAAQFKEVSFGKATVSKNYITFAEPQKVPGEPLDTSPHMGYKGLDIFRAGKQPRPQLIWDETSSAWRCGVGEELHTLGSQEDFLQLRKVNAKQHKGYEEEIENIKERLSGLADEGYSTGSYPEMLSKLADRVTQEEEEARHQSMESNVGAKNGSMLNYTLGAGLDAFRVLFSIGMEALNLDKAHEGKLGTKTGIYLDSIFKPREMAELLNYLHRFEQQSKNFFHQDKEVLIATIIEVTLDSFTKYAAERKLSIDMQSKLEELTEVVRLFRNREKSAQFLYNGNSVRNWVLENLWAPLFEPQSLKEKAMEKLFGKQNLDHKILKELKLLLLEILRNLWKKFCSDYVFSGQKKLNLDGRGQAWLRQNKLKNIKFILQGFVKGTGLITCHERKVLNMTMCPMAKTVMAVLHFNDQSLGFYDLQQLIELYEDHELNNSFQPNDLKPNLTLNFTGGTMIDSVQLLSRQLVLTCNTRGGAPYQVFILKKNILVNAYQAELDAGKGPRGIFLKAEEFFSTSRNFQQRLLPMETTDKSSLIALNLEGKIIYKWNLEETETGKHSGILATTPTWKEDVIKLNFDQLPEVSAKGGTPKNIYHIYNDKKEAQFVLMVYEDAQGLESFALGYGSSIPWFNADEVKWLYSARLAEGMRVVGVGNGGFLYLNDRTNDTWAMVSAEIFINPKIKPAQGPNQDEFNRSTRVDHSPILRDAQGELSNYLRYYDGNVNDLHQSFQGSFAIRASKLPWISILATAEDGGLRNLLRVNDQNLGHQIAHHLMPGKWVTLSTRGKGLEIQVTE